MGERTGRHRHDPRIPSAIALSNSFSKPLRIAGEGNACHSPLHRHRRCARPRSARSVRKQSPGAQSTRTRKDRLSRAAQNGTHPLHGPGGEVSPSGWHHTAPASLCAGVSFLVLQGLRRAARPESASKKSGGGKDRKGRPPPGTDILTAPLPTEALKKGAFAFPSTQVASGSSRHSAGPAQPLWRGSLPLSPAPTHSAEEASPRPLPRKKGAPCGVPLQEGPFAGPRTGPFFSTSVPKASRGLAKTGRL